MPCLPVHDTLRALRVQIGAPAVGPSLPWDSPQLVIFRSFSQGEKVANEFLSFFIGKVAWGEGMFVGPSSLPANLS
jgi:hypothetical protein